MPPTILNHASGSANPATSLASLWAYVEPALDHIVKSPSNDPNGKAPAIDFGLYAGIHSACYNYFTTQSEGSTINVGSKSPTVSKTDGAASTTGPADIYEQLDKYFAEAAREIALGAPLDDVTLVQYLVPSFDRYRAGALSANRLLNYVNRHYVKRAIDEDKGWLRLSDVLRTAAKTYTSDDSREVISRLLRERRLEELKKWGYVEGDSQEKLAYAESCAEASSSTDRIVPIISLALRRFRTEVVEPLLTSPKIKGKSNAKRKIPKTVTPTPALPKGRLARAVKELLETDAIDGADRLRLAKGLVNTLESIGVKSDHLSKKQLGKYIASVPDPPVPSSSSQSEVDKPVEKK